MPFSLPALMLGAHSLLGANALVLVADRVPEFDARPGCQAGATSGLVAKPDVDGCVRGELRARDQIVKEWGEFASADKTRCVESTHMGGPPSYVEVLTCLEIARDVRRLGTTRDGGNTGLSTDLSR